jgi:hypothetical protein
MEKIKNKTKYIMKFISIVIFLVTTIIFLLIAHDAFGYDDFCDLYKEENFYSLSLPNGETCYLLWSGFVEPVFYFFCFHFITQTLLWIIYGLIRIYVSCKKQTE